jgi:hypothetical protein
MADPSVVNFYSDFVGFWRRDFNIFDLQLLAGFPGDCCLW